MALVVAPDIEQIVGTYLRDHPDVRAVVSRVGSRTPPDTSTPWVRYVQIEDWGKSGPANHFDGYLLQFDCHAGSGTSNTRESAALIGRTVRAALVAMAGVYEDAVITAVTASGSRIPDDRLDPARERYIITATVFAHGAL